jgi:CubicO group peptidase (beta-lactamase class C family)
MTTDTERTVNGTCHERFSDVRDELERSFAERGEVGASVCVMVDGETVVDLWGGVADPATGRPWEADTTCMVWSCTKGAVALCAHVLVDRGLLDLDAPVTAYWPEFGQHGKEHVTVRMLLAHQAGIGHVRAPLTPEDVCDWDRMCELLAAEVPFWEPGTRHGYHALTFGWLAGELVRRIDGRSLGTYFAEEVAGPLAIDFHIGTPAEHHARIAPNLAAPMPGPDAPLAPFHLAIMTDPSSPAALMMTNHGGFVTDPNHPMWWEAEIPAANGVTNGRGLAGMYQPLALGGSIGEVHLVGADTLARMGAVASAAALDACLLLPTRFSLGFMKSITNPDAAPGVTDVAVMSEPAFGHAGMGGSLGFADPSTRMSFGYAMNQQGGTILLNERGQSLVDATYRALGFRSRASGSWA